MKEKESIWKKIKRAFAFFGATAFVALPSATEASNIKEQSIDNDEKTTVVDYGENKLIENDIIHEEDGEIVVDEKDVQDFRESLRLEETTTSQQQQYNNIYDKLLNEFNNICTQKKFDDNTIKYLKATFEGLYKNYDDWKEVNRNWPSKNKFIENRFLKPLENVNQFKFYEENSKEAQEAFNNGNGYAFTDSDWNITVIYNENQKEENFNLCTERILHELDHIGQKRILFNEDFFENYEYMSDVILEGQATSTMKTYTQLKTEKLSSNFVELNGFSLEYKNNNGEGYAREASIYNSIQYLIGYDNMQDILENGNNVVEIRNCINAKYGNDLGSNIFEKIDKIYTARYNNNSKEELKCSTELQKMFLKVIEQDIDKLTTKNDIERYANIYRAYKINNLVKAYDNGKECTNEYFNINSLDDKMASKIIQTKAFGMDDKNIVQELLFTTNEEYDQMKENYSGIYIPANLNDVNAKSKDGNLVLNYNNITNNTTANKEITVMYMRDKSGKILVVEIPRETEMHKLTETEDLTR